MSKLCSAVRHGRWMVFALVAMFGLSGCLSMKSYVDPALPTVGKGELVVPAERKPVQVLFEFRTKGSANASATAQIRPRVVAVAAESGLFDGIGGPNGETRAGTLKVVIDNVPITDNAAAKGFGTGLTFGLVGTMVTDGYVCTMTYSLDGKVSETTVKHALHSTVGNKAGPPGLAPMTTADAVNVVMDQLVWNGLKQLADQGAFR
jgi:hypothetical protein